MQCVPLSHWMREHKWTVLVWIFVLVVTITGYLIQQFQLLCHY